MSIPIWRQIQKNNFTSWESLLDFLAVEPSRRPARFQDSNFPLNLPRRLAEKIPKNTLEDPILKQFLPILEEKSEVEGFVEDPVEDKRFRLTNCMLQKYEGRALMIASSACAMHCRYCFRKNYPYQKSEDNFDREIDLIEKDPSIKELILSGGDPLSLSNRSLSLLFDRLSTIAHLKIVRFHTRFPIGIPERIDDEFLNLLQNRPFQFFFIIHTNHPKELDTDVLKFLKKILALGIPILQQAVLLRGVNDTLETLKELYETLIYNGIVPYYLHKLDPVKGTNHFEVDEAVGKKLIAELRDSLPGYGVPHFVAEIPGSRSKTIIG